MKLLIAVIHKRNYRRLREALLGGGFQFTEIASMGGLLREGNTTLLIGVATTQVPEVIDLIKQHCYAQEEAVNVSPPETRAFADSIGETMTVSVGGAQVFVLNVEKVVTV